MKYLRRITGGALTTAVALAAGTACEPGSITEARDQLKRGGLRTLELMVVVTQDSVVVADFLPEDVDTVIGGISGVAIDRQTFIVPAVASFLVPVEFGGNAIDFGDFEDAVRDATINVAQARLVLKNDSAQQVVLSNVIVGVVELNPDGSVPLDAGGAPVFDTTATGVPRFVAVADPGSTVLTVPGNGTDTVDLDAALVVDGLVDLVLDGRRAAVVITGSGSGGGFPVTFLVGTMDLVVLLDLTLPGAGVELSSNTVQDGAELDAADAEQVAERVTKATFTATVVNGTPFAVDIDLAFLDGDLGEADLFALPGAVVIPRITLSGASVDAAGRVTAPATTTVTISLTGTQLQPLLREQFTSRSRISIRASAGAGGRAVVRPGDIVRFDARVAITIQAGGENQ